MLYRIGTQREIPSLCSQAPPCVAKELLRCIAALDREYGADRNYMASGGYALVAETIEDVQAIQSTIDYDTHPCEWAEFIGEDNEYISVLYLMNDDYTIQVLVPTAIAPKAILRELEE